MSTLITQTEVLKVPSATPKRERLVRSSSIEKIIKFNAYICSQNYFILPAILTWLKTSQSVLHANVEKIILFIKFFLFNSLVYKTLQSKTELILPSLKYGVNVSALFFIHYRDVIRLNLTNFANNCKLNLYLLKCYVEKYLFITSVYLTILIIFAQALVCACYVLSAFVFGGPIFLCICLYFMSYIYLKILMDFLRKSEKAALSEKKCDTKIPKNLIAKLDKNQTLSSLNLL